MTLIGVVFAGYLKFEAKMKWAKELYHFKDKDDDTMQSLKNKLGALGLAKFGAKIKNELGDNYKDGKLDFYKINVSNFYFRHLSILSIFTRCKKKSIEELKEEKIIELAMKEL